MQTTCMTETRAGHTVPSSKHQHTLVQVLLVQRMHLLREVRPVQRTRELVLHPCVPLPPIALSPGADERALAALPGELDLPPEQVVQQPHVRLDQHRQPARAHDEVRVDERDPEVLHHVRDLFPQPTNQPIQRLRKQHKRQMEDQDSQ